MLDIIRGMLRYSFNDIDYTFDGLTKKEKSIVGTAENMERLVAFAKGGPLEEITDPLSAEKE